MVYNVGMDILNTKKIHTAIIGGGAAGLVLATSLSRTQSGVAVFEKNDRVGRKLAATGNGQGNITNTDVTSAPYFSSTALGEERAKEMISAFDDRSLVEYFENLGLLLLFDERGRAYPAGRQASAISDALRFCAHQQGVQTYTQTVITALEKKNGAFVLHAQTADGKKTYTAENVVLCTGGKAAKNFGTDGTAYALATAFGHTVTPLYPSLVQMKTDTANIRTLKGIRVADAGVTASWQENGKRKEVHLRGDVIFTDYGVSGDAIFRLSAFVADKIQNGVQLSLDFLPDFDEERVLAALSHKRNAFPNQETGEWLCGIVNNQVGRAVMKTLPTPDLASVAKRVKAFPLAVKGTLGFDYAQVTKGGIPLEETDENLQSKKTDGLYFAGEILDVDGQCGGFNLQWAYASARTVAAAIAQKYGK